MIDLAKNPDKMSHNELRLEVKEWRREIQILRTLGRIPLYERLDRLAGKEGEVKRIL